jgi:hypothetical protein
MKKILALTVFILSMHIANAQCPQTSCVDSLASNITKDTLLIAAGYTNPVWKIINGPGVLGTNIITGLKPGQTTVLALTANSGNMSTVSVKVIEVAALPVKQRSVSGISFTVSGGIKFTFDDGSTQ